MPVKCLLLVLGQYKLILDESNGVIIHCYGRISMRASWERLLLFRKMSLILSGRAGLLEIMFSDNKRLLEKMFKVPLLLIWQLGK